MAVDLKDERSRKFVANMLVMRALGPVWGDITPEQFGKIHDALSVALEEVSRMTITAGKYGLSIFRELGTPEQEAADAEMRRKIAEALDG